MRDIIDIEISLVCSECGNSLYGSYFKEQIEVEPCVKCMEKEYESGNTEGYDQGYKEAEEKNT